MKLSFVLLILAFFLTQTASFAHDPVYWQKQFAADIAKAGPGFLTPDHPFYSLDLFWDRLKILFVLDKPERARKHFVFASERLREVEISLIKKDEKSLDLSLRNLFLELEGTKNLLKLDKQKNINIKEFAEEIETGLNVYQKEVAKLEKSAPKTAKAYLNLEKVKIEELLEETEKELK